MVANLIGGTAFIVAGACLLARGVLLSGRNPGWPTAPFWLRLAIEVGGFGILAQGAVTLVAKFPAGAVSVSAGLFIALVEVATFLNLMRQRRSLYLKRIS